ncbi:hypothetical protein [Enterococcus avium]|uniref:hypothetical protein n=1 Tax=Enterococcus avium TaxID=33945 RepID=UPI002E132C55
MDDIVPSLLETIEIQFMEQTNKSTKLNKLLEKLRLKKSTYLDANEYAIEVGKILAQIFDVNITADILPDGRMYFNIADRVLNTTLKKNHELLSSYVNTVQTDLNHEADLKLKAQVPDLNQDRIDGLINRIAIESSFDEIKWILNDPIINFCQSIVDDSIKKNADFHARAGLNPTITRRVRGNACDWCRSLAGTYEYYSEPAEFYHRHERCTCTVEYNPKDARGFQNSHTKKWRDPERQTKIEQRKTLYLRKRG